MTVKQLIAKLKKMPQNAQVYLADHDHGRYEVNGKADEPEAVDFSEDEDGEQWKPQGVVVKIQVSHG